MIYTHVYYMNIHIRGGVSVWTSSSVTWHYATWLDTMRCRAMRYHACRSMQCRVIKCDDARCNILCMHLE